MKPRSGKPRSGKPRSGFMLAEALCALALAALLGVACATALAGVRRAMVSAESRARAERGGREALQVVMALARDADSLVVLGDTAVELTIRIASGVVCARDSTSMTLPPARIAAGPALVARSQPVEAGDELTLLLRDTLVGVLRWERGTIDSVSERAGEIPCGSATGFVAASDAASPRLRLVPRSMRSDVRPGVPVRIGRRGRLALYYAGRGDWMLGWRRCAGGSCGVVQPVAGPLRGPSAGGFFAQTAGTGSLLVRVGVPGITGQLEARVTRSDVGR